MIYRLIFYVTESYENYLDEGEVYFFTPEGLEISFALFCDGLGSRLLEVEERVEIGLLAIDGVGGLELGGSLVAVAVAHFWFVFDGFFRGFVFRSILQKLEH